jgi:hypothetical protein
MDRRQRGPSRSEQAALERAGDRWIARGRVQQEKEGYGSPNNRLARRATASGRRRRKRAIATAKRRRESQARIDTEAWQRKQDAAWRRGWTVPFVRVGGVPVIVR